MLNAEDPAESYCIEEESHWTGQEEEKWYKFQFYRLESLESDGFIQLDGSLQLEFAIKRMNYKAKLALAEAKIE